MYKTLLYKWLHFWADVQYWSIVIAADICEMMWQYKFTIAGVGVLASTMLCVSCCARCMRRKKTPPLINNVERNMKRRCM